MKPLRLRSKRVAMRRQSFKRPNMRSMMLRCYWVFGRRWHGLDATLCDLAVMYVSGRQEQDAGSTLLIADGMELGVAAAFVAADTMSQGPPFPPPAQRWTLMQLLSMNSRSGLSWVPASALKISSQMPRSAQRTKRL